MSSLVISPFHLGFRAQGVSVAASARAAAAGAAAGAAAIVVVCILFRDPLSFPLWERETLAAPLHRSALRPQSLLLELQP